MLVGTVWETKSASYSGVVGGGGGGGGGGVVAVDTTTATLGDEAPNHSTPLWRMRHWKL